MRILIVGHRGSGKSSLLQRWKTYQPDRMFIDLDLEIEKRTLKTIQQIFETLGESEFRKIEVETLSQLSHGNSVIALGAGFPLEKIPPGDHILWLRRDTDRLGRIFRDRPRLNPELDPKAEFHFRFEQRESRYRLASHQIYTVPEGLEEPDPVEKSILTEAVRLNSYITLPAKGNYLNCEYETRDDLALDLQHASLFSVRRNQYLPDEVIRQNVPLDWDLSRPLPSTGNLQILSTHENTFQQALNRIRLHEGSRFHLKLCPIVRNWEELKWGYEWQQENPQQRSFLPRSEEGRWTWFRLFMKGRQKINFVREDLGSAPDQPTIWEWLSEPDSKSGFASVLGSPVLQSFSPVFHKKFFLSLGMPFYRIPLESLEWNEAFPFLQSLGLKAAAVTSPLKEKAGGWVQKEPLNTLVLSNLGWQGENTDLEGARGLLGPYAELNSVVVWGGGGVLPTLQKTLNKASYYSVRTGQPRPGYPKIQTPEVIVWAAPNGHSTLFPWKTGVKKILDLNYHANSEGLEFSQKLNCQYVSGREWFRLQALAQQKIWAQFSGLNP